MHGFRIFRKSVAWHGFDLECVRTIIDTSRQTGFSSQVIFRRSLLFISVLSISLAPGFGAGRNLEVRHLEKADALPLALDDAFSFRKHGILINDPYLAKPGAEEMVSFERDRVNYGAVTGEERNERVGQYFAFWWRAKREANLTVRFEFRQERLGTYVQAQETRAPKARGTMETKFQVVGDDYTRDGRVVAWRALLIENGRIVALRQSYLWY